MQGLTYEDIVIIGDSFAYHRFQNSDWPKYLTYLLTNQYDQPRGKGFPGASWWSTRKCLLEEIKKKPIKLLILCHTEPSRIPSDHDFGLNISSVNSNGIYVAEDKKINFYDQILIASKLYFEHLISLDFHKWARLKWLEELDTLVEEYQIPKVIHLYCFKDLSNIEFKNGITISSILKNRMTMHDIKARNHFTEEVNIQLAKELYKVINGGINSGVVNINI